MKDLIRTGVFPPRMFSVRRRRARLCALLCVLLAGYLSCGCTLFLQPPSAEALLSYETAPFLCSFSVTEPDGSVFSAALARTETEDTLTVTGKFGSRTVFCFSGGETVLFCAGSEAEEPMRIPAALPENSGAGLWRSLFCRMADTDTEVMCTEDGYAFSCGDDTFFFSRERVPLCIRHTGDDGETVLAVQSFRRDVSDGDAG